MTNIQLDINKQTRKQLRDNAEEILKAQGKTLEEFMDEKCIELVLFNPIPKQKIRSQQD